LCAVKHAFYLIRHAQMLVLLCGLQGCCWGTCAAGGAARACDARALKRPSGREVQTGGAPWELRAPSA